MMHMRSRPPETCISPGWSQPDVFSLAIPANPILPPKQQPTTLLELAVELGNSYLVQLLLDEGATVNPEGSVVPLSCHLGA